MIIGERLRALREQKKLSQGDIERRTGLLRCYISRVEHGHTVPSIETIEKVARALETPIYKIFYEGDEPPKLPKVPPAKADREASWGLEGKNAELFANLRRLLGRMDQKDRKLLLHMAQKMAGSRRKRGLEPAAS